jgi:hypothetical protein
VVAPVVVQLDGPGSATARYPEIVTPLSAEAVQDTSIEE